MSDNAFEKKDLIRMTMEAHMWCDILKMLGRCDEPVKVAWANTTNETDN